MGAGGNTTGTAVQSTLIECDGGGGGGDDGDDGAGGGSRISVTANETRLAPETTKV